MPCSNCDLEKYEIEPGIPHKHFESRVLQLLTDMNSEGSAPFDPKRATDIIIGILEKAVNNRRKDYKIDIYAAKDRGDKREELRIKNKDIEWIWFRDFVLR